MGVTIKQIAVEAGLSWPAVSQILRSSGRFAPATRQRVLAVAAKHGYRPNASARSLRERQSRLIGVVFRNAPDQPFTNMVAYEYLLGINQAFQSADYATVLVRAGELLGDDASEPRVFRERLVDGLIAVGAFPRPVTERLSHLSPNAIWLDGPVWTSHNCLRRDEHAAGRMAGEAAADLGYRAVRFITRDVNRLVHHSHLQRELGARAAAEQRGLAMETAAWPEDDRAAEAQAVRDAVAFDGANVVGSMPVARRLAAGAAALGRVPGHHFGLISCDDSIETHVGWPGLCRVAFDRFDMGRTAAGMMLELLNDPDHPPASRLAKSNYYVIGHSAWGPGWPAGL